MALILLHLMQELDCYRQFMPLISLLSIRGFDLDTFKGTVARDFLVSLFFMDLLYMGPGFRG
jgi:hypothetical protein